MKTGKRGHCPWTELAVCLSVAVATSPMAWAVPNLMEAMPAVDTAGPTPPTQEDLYLEVELNHVQRQQISHFVRRDQRFYAEAGTLRELGLTWPGAASASGFIALDSLPGLSSRYDVAKQRIDITVPVALIDGATKVFGYQTPVPPQLDPATKAPGLLLNYDVYAQGNGQTRGLNAWTEARLFGVGPGVWQSSALMSAHGGPYLDNNRRTIRLDTSWQMSFPEKMVSVTLGDSFSSALPWTRTTRFGGLRVSRNFSLQPYRVTVPLASFVGEVAVPSSVDLYINGIREAQSQVAPGKFQVISAPLINGAGNAQMMITDITGQTRVINFALYNSARLLQQGLSDWSFEVGKLRRNYGQSSSSYADALMLSGSARYGLSNRWTLEAHAESMDGLRMAGLGSLLLLGQRGGVLSTSYAASRHGQDSGHQHGVGYEWQGSRLTVNLATQKRNDGFRDAASLEGSVLPLRTDRAFFGVNVGRGQIGTSYVRQDYRSSPRASYASLNWAYSLGWYGNISLSFNRDLDGDGGNGAYFYWSLPLGDRHHAWASLERQRQGNTRTAGAMRALPGDDDGWGWRVQTGTGGEAGAQAEISQIGRYGQWQAGTQRWGHQDDSQRSTYAGASGSLLLMQSKLFPMRRVHDAFALVSTDGIADVPVMLENRRVGTTDSRGLLLVTPLNAWQNNDLSIDPLVLPPDVNVQQVHMVAVPSTGSGMLARFPMKAVVVVELALRQHAGDWIPAGSHVVLSPGGQRVTVGYDGRVYLENPPAGATLSVTMEASACSAQLPDNYPPRGRIDLGVVPCQ